MDGRKQRGGGGLLAALRDISSPARQPRRSPSSLSEPLPPLFEGPDGGGGDLRKEGWRRWLPSSSSAAAAAGFGGVSGGDCRGKGSVRMLLGVLGAPLAPLHVAAGEPLPHLSIKDTPIETSSAQYILQQYVASCGGMKVLSSVRSSYAMGKVRMAATEYNTSGWVVKSRSLFRSAKPGCFVLWRMAPEMWYLELALSNSKVHAGCNGSLVWCHTLWLGGRAARGPVRPLRRALQGLDPLTTASIFSGAHCIGERKVHGEDCFILKLSVDPETLKARNRAQTEIIRHELCGYFSQKSGLLVQIDDSHLTRVLSGYGGDASYWETTISSSIEDYRPVDGVMIAHSGHSAVTVFRFGQVAMSHTKTKMEEAWTIEEVAFNVPGLSMDFFIPPTDLTCESVGEADELPQREMERSGVFPLEQFRDCSFRGLVSSEGCC